MDRLGIVEAVEDSKNDETFEDAAPVTPGTLAELASATLEMVETQGSLLVVVVVMPCTVWSPQELSDLTTL